MNTDKVEWLNYMANQFELAMWNNLEHSTNVEGIFEPNIWNNLSDLCWIRVFFVFNVSRNGYWLTYLYEEISLHLLIKALVNWYLKFEVDSWDASTLLDFLTFVTHPLYIVYCDGFTTVPEENIDLDLVFQLTCSYISN